jgi:beta-glucanase (GH16 family)
MTTHPLSRYQNRAPFTSLICHCARLALIAAPLVAHAQVGLDNTKWAAFSRAGGPTSDLQCYTPGNVSVRDGSLILVTKIEAATCKSVDLKPATNRYTSGFVAMRSFRFLYGVVEVRAKFGGGNHSGAWPIIWLADNSCQASDPTGTDDLCNEQEVDIAEILDGNFNQVNQQIHVDHFLHNDGCKPEVPDTSLEFHVYRLEWSKGSMIFKIDGKTTCTITKSYVPVAPMYLKISVFVGRFGGPINDRSLPWGTGIDYVKITQDGKVLFDDEFDGSGRSAAPLGPVQTKSQKTAGGE